MREPIASQYFTVDVTDGAFLFERQEKRKKKKRPISPIHRCCAAYTHMSMSIREREKRKWGEKLRTWTDHRSANAEGQYRITQSLYTSFENDEHGQQNVLHQRVHMSPCLGLRSVNVSSWACLSIPDDARTSTVDASRAAPVIISRPDRIHVFAACVNIRLNRFYFF